VEYDLATAIVKVTYNEKRTDLEKLRKAINKLGYSADSQEPEKGKKAECGHKKGEKHSCSPEDGHKH
jgi:hypothetical protein